MPATATDHRLELLQSAPLDSWIALSDNNELIASGKSYQEVVDTCDKIGAQDPTVIKTPKEWGSLSL